MEGILTLKNIEILFAGGHNDDDDEYVDDYDDVPHRRRRQRVEDDDRRHWETGMRTEIPEFRGGLQPEEFLDWLATVEEVLDFKGVLKNKRVPLVATRF